MSAIAAKPKERFVFIDGLRAVLAVDVMFHHLYFLHDTSHDALRSMMPAILRWPLEQDLQRIQCFFVISGFVIAWSLRNMRVNVGNAANFILRRQIRLDPAYWVCLVASVLFMIAQSIFVDHSRWADVAGPGRLLVNMLYLQYITRVPTILYVSWTLCLEVQLYLVFIIHLFLIQYLIRRYAWAKKRPAVVYVGMMTPLWLVSLRWHWYGWAWPYFVQSWYLFVMGVLVCWVMERRMSAVVLLVAAIAEVAYGIVYHDPHVFWSVGIVALIYLSIAFNGLTKWLGNGVVQFFGRISYSLFLVHWDVGRTVLGWGLHFNHSRAAIAVWFLLAAAASVGAAHLLYILVERPSMNMAAWLKPRPVRPITDLPADSASLPQAVNPA
jgi:peptidoglycan/LPS O-acetylase OafA/YrhL